MQALADIEMTWLEKAHVEGKQNILLRQLTVKFGELPEVFVRRLTSVKDSDVLDTLSEQVLVANSLEEIYLPEESGEQ